MKVPYLEITGEINNEAVTKFRKDYAEIVEWYNKRLKKDKINVDAPINLFLNTLGGSVDDAFTIHDIIVSGLQSDPCFYSKVERLNIVTFASGCVWSAGLIIFLASDQRRSYENSSFMIHDIQFSEVSGDLKSVTRLNAFAEKQRDKMMSLFIDRAGWSEHLFPEFIRSNVEFYFDAQEAKALKVVNEEIMICKS